jgi:hypothetical protein
MSKYVRMQESEADLASASVAVNIPQTQPLSGSIGVGPQGSVIRRPMEDTLDEPVIETLVRTNPSPSFLFGD